MVFFRNVSEFNMQASPTFALAFLSYSCYQTLPLPCHFSATLVIKPSLCPGIFQPLLLSNPPSALAFFSHSCYQTHNLPLHLLSTSVIKPAICPGIFQPLLLSNPPSALAFFSHSCYQTLPLPWHFSATPVIKPSLCPGIFQQLLLSNHPSAWHFSAICYEALPLPWHFSATPVYVFGIIYKQQMYTCMAAQKTWPTHILSASPLHTSFPYMNVCLPVPKKQKIKVTMEKLAWICHTSILCASRQLLGNQK
jgi:hypothetical protein